MSINHLKDSISEVYPGLLQTCKMEHSATIGIFLGVNYRCKTPEAATQRRS